MYKEIGNSKNSILKSRRNTESENTFALDFIKPALEIADVESTVITLPRHVHKDESRRDVLRNYTGKRDAVLCHMADYNEKQI